MKRMFIAISTLVFLLAACGVQSETDNSNTNVQQEEATDLSSVVNGWQQSAGASVEVAPIATAVALHVNNAVGVTINGVAVNFDGQGPAIVDGRTLVPVRGVFEVLRFDVGWDGDTRQVTLSRDDDIVVITIDSATFTANGRSHSLDVPAQIIGGRTLVPIRAVLESVGYEVRWDGGANTVTISTQTVGQATTQPASLELQSWQRVYAEFMRSDHRGDFALFDMDRDGVPELLIKTTDDVRGYVLSIYAYRYDHIQHLGEFEGVGGWLHSISIPSSNDIHGIFVDEHWGAGSAMYLLTLQNGELFEQAVSSHMRVSANQSDSFIGVIENNLVARRYNEWTNYDESGADTGFEAARARLAGTPLGFHPINTATIALEIYGVTMASNPHPFATGMADFFAEQLTHGQRLLGTSARFIDLDDYGTQGVLAIKMLDTDLGQGMVGRIFYMSGDQVASHDIGNLHGGRAFQMVGVTERNRAFEVNIGGGRGYSAVYSVVQGQIVQDVFVSTAGDTFYHNGNSISETEYDRQYEYRGLSRTPWELLEASIADQTPQILAMPRP